jgi:hypothetical protein
MGENDDAAHTPMPSPLLEKVVGSVAKIAVLTLLPAWAVWLVGHHTGSYPPSLWVVTMACPAVITACRERGGRRRKSFGGLSNQG